MKKKYIQPNVSVSFVVVESLLQNTSGGLNKDQNDDGGSCSKKYEFTDDFFYDTPWPESESLWD